MKGLFNRIIRSGRYRLFIRPFSPLVRVLKRSLDKDFKPKIIVKVDGGLGSQMWQYALGRAAGKASGLPVFYDMSWFDTGGLDGNGVYSRAYQLENVFPVLNISPPPPEVDLYRTYFDIYPGTRFNYDEKILSSEEARYLGGYYVNAKYIDQQGDSLRDEFTFNVCMSPENRDVLSVIEAEQNSVALHIRRGDFVGSVHDVTTPKYFRDAVKLVADKLSPAKGVFFVFSNGLDWSREILSEIDQKCIFVDNNNNDNGAIDMFLMSKCSHFIISNSSFSWWPAWLSRRTPGKTVVMPNIWLAGESAGNRHSMRNDGWIELPVI